jgi:hypothetical protein
MYPGGYPPYPVITGQAKPQTGARSLGLIIGLVVTLVVILLGGVTFGLYALRTNLSPSAVGGVRIAATATTTAASGAPANALYYDSLAKDDLTGWATNDGHCTFRSDGFHVTNNRAQSNYYGWFCAAPTGTPSDGILQVTADEVSGTLSEPFGMYFRANSTQSGASGDQLYWYVITGDGHWALIKEYKGKYSLLRDYTLNDAIHGGLNQVNTLSIEFRGQELICKVNGVVVGQVNDTGAALDAGYTGLGVGADNDVVFRNYTILP